MKLTQQTILITGGNSGIGLNLVKQLHSMGNSLIVISRSQNNWEQLSRLHPGVHCLQCDLSNKEQVVHLVESLNAENRVVDVLVNCAALQFTPKLIDDDFSFDSVDTEIHTNFSAIVWLSYLLLPKLLLRPSSAIVNLSSGLAIYPKTASAVYCAPKAAVHSFSQSLRYQLSDSPVKVIEVLLPLVDTPMTAGRGKGKISSELAAKKIIKGIEQGRDEIYVGKAKFLPFMARLWPGLMKRILRGY